MTIPFLINDGSGSEVISGEIGEEGPQWDPIEEGTHYRRKERRDHIRERRHHSGTLWRRGPIIGGRKRGTVTISDYQREEAPQWDPVSATSQATATTSPALTSLHCDMVMGVCPPSGGVTALLVGVLALGVLGQVGQATREPHEGTQERSFSIDYDNNQFLKDGEPFRYVSGSIHYFRTLPSEWRDRLKKMRMAGFNALETYVEWSSHEPEQGTYDFSGINDLPSFLTIAQEEDLVVILRLGPYVDAERDMNDPGVTHRLSDPVTSMEGEGADRSLPIVGREIREEDPCGLFSVNELYHGFHKPQRSSSCKYNHRIATRL
ncbi:Beta-galactosidase [Chionoecetes opilio]|uniref:Beta-galactosidase n=1 Tax=Chionoecetes opilio TaxID=41210 RepID=A0A8J5D1T6_CHIOP|nr:Beta-galactosidase [Chionoecetes opilio]